MKKIMFVFGVLGMAFAATAELDTLISFRTTGPDKYKDGTTVIDGECYALVWTKTGCEFQGLNADGTCVDSVNNAVVLVAPLAQGGKCSPVMYVVKADKAAEYADGEYGVYLLDTRVTKTDDDGKVVCSVGFNDEGKLSVNGFAAVESGLTSTDGGMASASASAPVSVAAASGIPAGTQAPKIKKIDFLGDDKVILTVSNTHPYLQYNVAVGETPVVQGAGAAEAPMNGAASLEGEIKLIVPKDGDKKFFKVQRN